MKEIPSYQEAIANPNKILEFQATAGLKFGSWSMFFNDDSVSHPAKMNLRMLEWIIDNYSKPGDLIMDMFAGTGSTLIMASRKGRDAIGVELEQHFIDTMIVPNIKTSQSQTLLSGKPGKIIIVKGDSRRLDLLIPQAINSIITSPPYGTKAFADKQWMIDKMPEIEQRIREGKTKGNPRSPEAEIKHLEKIKDTEHPDSIDNIDNYGQVDAVFSSPPYGQSVLFKSFKSEEDRLVYAKKLAIISNRSVKAALTNLNRWTDYGDNPNNLGNLPHGKVDTVISGNLKSKTIGTIPHVGNRESMAIGIHRGRRRDLSSQEQGHKAQQERVHLESNDRDWEHRPVSSTVDQKPDRKTNSQDIHPKGNPILSDNFNIELDKRDFTPDHAIHGIRIEKDSIKSSVRISSIDRKRQKTDRPSGSEIRRDSHRTEKPSQKHIDSIITSPPYGAMLSKRSGGDDRPEAMRRVMEEDWGYSPKMVDKILAGETNVLAYVTRRGYNYSGDDANIGNLPTGKIDSAISSPPYEGSLENRGGTQQKFKQEKGTPAPYSKDPENIGNKTGETYLEAMFKVYLGCWLVMKEGGIMVIVVKNFVRKGKPVRLDLDTIKLCEAAGFKLTDRWWFRLPFRSFWTIQHTKKWAKTHPNSKEHPYAIFEDLLVFSREPLGAR